MNKLQDLGIMSYWRFRDDILYIARGRNQVRSFFSLMRDRARPIFEIEAVECLEAMYRCFSFMSQWTAGSSEPHPD